MSKTILCADDSVTMQKVAEITFRATEFDYVGAQSADEALTKAKQTKPTLILADAVMPDKDGYELCKAIKSDPALADVPVVLMCGKSQAFDPQKGSDVGADGHVTKPWDTQVMIDKVGEILGKVGTEGVAKSGGAAATPAGPPATPAAAKPSPAPAAKPSPPATPSSPSSAPSPKVPNIPAQNPAAGRSATIMGMPTIKPPMKSPSAPGVTSVSPSAKPQAPAPASKPPTPPAKPAAPAPKPAPAPASAKPTPPRATPPGGVATASRGNAAASRGIATPPRGIDRPPMIKGIPTKKLKPVSAQVASKVAAAAADVAKEAGLDPAGPEMQALLKLSADVIERIAWEVIPELAEAMLRENLPDLAAKQ